MPTMSRQPVSQMLVEAEGVGDSCRERRRRCLRIPFLLQELKRDVQKTKEAFVHNSALLDRLPPPAERDTHVLLAGQRHSLQRASSVGKMLLVKENEFEVPLLLSFKL